MDNDDYLTNLSWLKYNELRTKVECTNKHIDDDLQCLCWLHKIRPSSSSHSLKRLSVAKNNYRNSNRSKNTDSAPISGRILLVRTLFPSKVSQQSFILIRSSNGKIFCLSIRHFV